MTPGLLHIVEMGVWIRPDRVFLIRPAMELQRRVEDRCVLEFESGRELAVPCEADAMANRIGAALAALDAMAQPMAGEEAR